MSVYLGKSAWVSNMSEYPVQNTEKKGERGPQPRLEFSIHTQLVTDCPRSPKEKLLYRVGASLTPNTFGTFLIEKWDVFLYQFVHLRLRTLHLNDQEEWVTALTRVYYYALNT